MEENAFHIIKGAIINLSSDDVKQIAGDAPLPSGFIIINWDTRELLVTDGVTPTNALKSHQHINYAHIDHTHPDTTATIGELVSVAIPPNVVQQYRIPCDGRALPVLEYPVLHHAIGHYHDPLLVPSSILSSTGIITANGTWFAENDGADIESITITSSQSDSSKIVGSYRIVPMPGKKLPVVYTLYGITSTGEERILHDVSGYDGTYTYVEIDNDTQYESYRFDFVEWSDDGSGVGIQELYLKIHDKGMFHIPTCEVVNNITTCIISDK